MYGSATGSFGGLQGGTIMAAEESTETGTAAVEATSTVTSAAKVGRNDACPCGSGKKFKKCCVNEPAYNVVPEAKVATSPKAPARAAATPGHPAAQRTSFKSVNAPSVAKTSTKRKV
jgi:hypothetical protein